MEIEKLSQIVETEDDSVPYREILTAGGCSRDSHKELTMGLGRFDSKLCPVCNLQIYRP